jgi:hypothetical protein
MRDVSRPIGWVEAYALPACCFCRLPHVIQHRVCVLEATDFSINSPDSIFMESMIFSHTPEYQISSQTQCNILVGSRHDGWRR